MSGGEVVVEWEGFEGESGLGVFTEESVLEEKLERFLSFEELLSFGKGEVPLCFGVLLLQTKQVAAMKSVEIFIQKAERLGNHL